MFVLLAFSFLAGAATILAPCIWPVLPLVLSVSSTGGRRKPLGVTLGVMTSFVLFTLFVSYLERFLHIGAGVFRWIAVVLIALLGVALVIPSLGTRFEVWISRLLQPLQGRLQGPGQAKAQGFAAGYLAGFSVGVVWAPCAGPILATVATLAATRAVSAQVFLVTCAYASGLGVPLLLVSLGGSWIFGRMRRFNKFTGRVQQAMGVVMIGVALLMVTNEDKLIQLRILKAFPSYGNLLGGLEDNRIVSSRLDALRGTKSAQAGVETKAGELPDLGPAPEFTGITRWLNSPPLTMAGLKGKVVLVDFWTYSCINCLRTLPNTKAWYKEYGPDHFVLIGVHAPEFAFEKDTSNVQKALKEFGITYPVAQDNGFATWNAFHNEYWPAEYLIDAQGRIRRADFGEGGYDAMDAAIRRLLADAGHPAPGGAALVEAKEDAYAQTPESYLGLDRLARFDSPQKAVPGRRTYSLPKTLAQDGIAYEGPWTLTDEAAKPAAGSALELRFTADKVYLVIGPGGRGGRLALFLDGKPIAAAGGADVRGGRVVLDTHRLYGLVDLGGKPGSHLLRIVFRGGGTAVYAFTFG